MESSKLPPAFIEMQFSSITMFNLRFSHHIMKINENLHSFITMMEESNDDIEPATIQREKRFRVEFARRFTRDYLYPVQLKINELENKYLLFISDEHCKVAQSMMLRPLVLALLNKLSSSTQVYLQFLRKNNGKVYVKLKEILNFISHSYEIIKAIVDHRILKNNDIEKLCAMISNYANNQKQKILHPEILQDKRLFNCGYFKKNFTTKKPKLKKITLQKLKKSQPDLQSENKTENTRKPKDLKHFNNHHCHDSLNTSYISIKRSSPAKGIESNDRNIKSNSGKNSIFLHNSISEVCSRISDRILNELVVDVSIDVTECIQKLAFDAFDLELYNNC